MKSLRILPAFFSLFFIPITAFAQTLPLSTSLIGGVFRCPEGTTSVMTNQRSFIGFNTEAQCEQACGEWKDDQIFACKGVVANAAAAGGGAFFNPLDCTCTISYSGWKLPNIEIQCCAYPAAMLPIPWDGVDVLSY